MNFRKKKEKGKEKLFVASQWQLIRWKFYRHKLAVVSLVVLSILFFCAIFAEFVSPYDPRKDDIRHTLCPPSRLHFFDEKGFHFRPFVYRMQKELNRETLAETYREDKTREFPLFFFVHGDPYKLWGKFPLDIHLLGVRESEGVIFLFGADELGRDLFSRIIFGARISLSIGLIGVAISFMLGIIIGGISGYVGGRVDLVIQRVIEFLISIPTLPLWMALSVALPPHWSIIKVYFGIVVILSLLSWPGVARVVRGKFMAVKEEDFVMAAKVQGASGVRIIFIHLLPSFYSHIIASLTLSIPGMILGETSLSFIGLGLQAPAISWGVLLKKAQAIRILANAPWLLIPGLFVIVTVLSFNFIGDGLRDAADPYSAI